MFDSQPLGCVICSNHIGYNLIILIFKWDILINFDPPPPVPIVVTPSRGNVLNGCSLWRTSVGSVLLYVTRIVVRVCFSWFWNAFVTRMDKVLHLWFWKYRLKVKLWGSMYVLILNTSFKTAHAHFLNFGRSAVSNSCIIMYKKTVKYFSNSML